MLNIRQATEQDLNQIISWTLQLHQHEDDGEIKTSAQFKDKLSQWLKQEINNANSLFLMAETSSKPVGFIGAMSVLNDNGFLEDMLKGLVHLLWIEPEFRQQNIAQQLVSEVEKCFESIGINYVECNYTANNQLAANFWQSQGYLPSSITARKMLNQT